MSTTLTNGLKLPDKGSVDWYSDMQNNYTILDGAVGTIAEHTTALAGKAPAVHTHTVSDITDFPAYGNAAGTICEGNDSRLSDARTPVAHTHTKSDVTDLLNSNFIPSANNSYDLGSSSYQWNNVYSKNYFYNGTAWGLDKANYWTNNNTFDTTVRVKSLTQEIGVTPSESKFTYCDFKDKNEVSIAQIITAQFANGYDTISLNMYNKYTNGVKDPNGFSINAKFETGLTPAGQAYLNTNGKWLCDLTPIVSNFNLGTSTNQWKTLNGINPGALSIFNPSATHDPIDVPNTWVTDGSAWNTLNVSNMGDGWICLTYKRCGTNDYILVRFGSSSASYPSMIFPATRLQTSGYYLYLLVPVAKAMGNIYLEIKLDSNAELVAHSFIPSYGTV